MDQVENLGIIDCKWGKVQIPGSADKVSIEGLQYGGPKATKHRQELQNILLETYFIVEGGYIIATDEYGNILFQISDDLMLGKFPGGKNEDSALEEFLADAYVDLAPYRHILEAIRNNKILGGKEAALHLNINRDVIINTSEEILNEWLDIVSKSAPRDMGKLKKLAQKKEAKPFISSWLGIESKSVRDFIKKKKGADEEHYITLLDEIESKKGKKDIIERKYYDKLFEGNIESIQDTIVRECKAETGYSLDKKKLTPWIVVYETKLTSKGTRYLKKRTIFRYSGVLGEQGKMSLSLSEKEQGLRLETSKNTEELYTTLSGLTDKKLKDPGFWRRLLGVDKKYSAKISSALVTFAVLKYLKTSDLIKFNIGTKDKK